MYTTIDGKIFRVISIEDERDRIDYLNPSFAIRSLPPELINADHKGDRAKVHAAHYPKCGVWVWEFTLTTPNGETRDTVYDYEEAKKLWNTLIDIVDAWDEYEKEVD